MEAEAYLPLLDQIRQTGLTCILVHMPFRMTIFGANSVEGLILLGAYIYGPQKGDLAATISTEEQQPQAVTAIQEFINRN